MANATINGAIYSNLYSTKFGGTTEPGVADPYLSGYGWVWFKDFPAEVANYTQGLTQNQCMSALTALAIGYTLPEVTLGTTTQEGLGGLSFSVPTKLEIGHTCTIKFIEMSGTPVYSIIHGWIQYIRDVRTGLAANLNATNKASYSASCYFWTTKPDGQTIEEAYLVTGMFPTTDPIATFNTERATVEKHETDITFSLDNIWPSTSANSNFGNAFILNNISSLQSQLLAMRNTWINWGG